MHAHFYGGPLPELLRARREGPCLRPALNGGEEMLAMNGAFPFTPAHFDPDVCLRQMDASGLTQRMLTFPGALGVDILSGPGIGAAISAFNEHLASLGASTGGRLIGLAGLPLAEMDVAAHEMRRTRRELGLPGVILPGNYFESIERARELEPVLVAANETGSHVMIHPGLRVGEAGPAAAPDHPQFRTSTVVLQSQVAQTVLTLLLSDLLDVFPRISFQVVNLGGTIPFILERMESIARHRDDAPFPTGRLRRLWYDSASLGPRALELAVEVFGADRVMLGSDWPIFHDDPVAGTLRPSRLSSAQKAAVSGGTAGALLARLNARECD
ncbi:MAG: amidohydrolase family protein [Rhodobacteraceae bacterium]|nr:amidohydrolase family protein [Paracoccaceae bacterium]